MHPHHDETLPNQPLLIPASVADPRARKRLRLILPPQGGGSASSGRVVYDVLKVLDGPSQAKKTCSSVRPLRLVPLAFYARITSHPAAFRAARWSSKA